MKGKYLINNSVLYSPDEHRLTPLGRRGNETTLNGPVNRCLLLLLQNPGEVIRQDLMFKEVWEKHGQFVTLNTLYQNILLLRRGMMNAGIIKESIKTIPKVGIKFTGTVQFIEEEDDIYEKTVGITRSATSSASTEQHTANFTEQVDSVIIEEKEKGKSISKSLNNYFHENKGILFFFPAVFFIFLASLFTSGSAKNFLFFSTHDEITRINQCSVYIDRGDMRLTSGEITDFLKGRNLRCDSDEFLYITRTPTGDNVLVLFCDTATDGDIQCSTRFNIASNSLKPMNL